ncbi:Oxidoreductase, short chain dehydrogenase/reductase family [Candidatus Rhodobacter oscarellae]|uniref:Oxidoreductase, short chain dehydrogenase/reductase family n=1 Tax=Candidatus Rhodobacter oscarellae TaxID=1675527 RepID=A0A0J9E9I4_9RHOB|nr:SDR family oxidoreductase [Candidatus Rhodobacter lobularis]KMW59445.1 Oxidoreductase, short chain dehydrogenase/reductase family [Candidatus Rhodobacter lobularis]
MSKSIVITGASSGIGRATAEHFIAQGWTVGALARRADALAELAGEKVIALPADVTDPDAVEAAFDDFVGKAGRIDALFNNAGMFGVAAPIDEVPVETWLQVVNVNLTGMFLCARQAFKHMRAQGGGRIINNGSISAHVPRDGSICYTSTKHAVTGLTRTLSLDGRALNIACGQIDIGNAETDMVRATNARRVSEGLTADPVMDVQNVAEAVMYMAELPLNANVQFMTVMATQMPYIGRG